MPLSARLSDRSVLGALLSDADWFAVGALAKSDADAVRTVCCGWPAVPKVSRRGLRFFAHPPGSDCKLGEGADHLAVKALAAKALHERGFAVCTEYAGPGWRADVYGRMGSREAVVEVQWSAQTAEVTEQRTARLEASGVEVLWLQRNGSTATRPDAPVCLELRRSAELGDGYAVGLGGWTSVRDAVDAWLDGELIRVPWIAVSNHERVTVEQHPCTVCGARAQSGPAWLRALVTQRCGCGVHDHGASYERNELARQLRQQTAQAFGSRAPGRPARRPPRQLAQTGERLPVMRGVPANTAAIDGDVGDYGASRCRGAAGANAERVQPVALDPDQHAVRRPLRRVPRALAARLRARGAERGLHHSVSPVLLPL